MRRIILVLFSFMGLFMTGVQAQDSCSAAGINARVDTLIATYTQARPDDAIDAAEALKTGLDDLLADCASVEAASDSEPGEALDAAALTPGQWQVIWRSEHLTTTCPNNMAVATARNRPFLLQVDAANDRFTAADNYAWLPLVFTATGDGDYSFNRNEVAEDGTPTTYEYRVTITSPEQMDGIITNYIPAHDCTLQDMFQMQLVQEDVICMVNADTSANLRGGPGTGFERTGELPIPDLQPVIGQAQGSDGLIWWQLTEDTWVRSDLVNEAGDCENVPVVEAE